MTLRQEREAVQRAQNDPQAFAQLYDAYFPRMHAYVRYRVPGTQDAEDLIADVFFRALRELPQFKWRHDGSFAAWLFRIAHNLVADHYRRRASLHLPLVTFDSIPEPVNPAPPPDEVAMQQEAFQQIRALVTTLSPRRQEIITLRFFGGLRNREIASILGLDERTIAAHVSRGLRDLQSRYTAQAQSEVAAEKTV